MRLDTRRVRVVASALALGIGMAGLTATGASAAGTPSAAPWAADGCYTWDGGLSNGDEGDAVKQLQTRVAGWSDAGAPIAVDGVFGDDTEAALKRFQKGYGIKETGKGDTATYDKIYELQSDDCSPAHFEFSEFASKSGGFSGGNVSEAQAKENVLLTMWKLEALRHKMGDKPVQVSSAFRTVEENEDVGGVPNSNHTYGTAADLIGSHSFCDMAVQSQDTGFNEIIGPGAENHDDHTHVATRSDQNWNAPDCF